MFRPPERRGIFMVVAALSLVVVFGFVALTVDVGLISLTKTRLQNAVDASALAASQEITAAIEQAASQGSGGDGVADANAIAVEAAKLKAVAVAEANGVFVDPSDVQFGKRVYNSQNGGYSILWDQGPYSVVKVTARRDNPDTSAPDGKLKLMFAPVMGDDATALSASATAFVEARDLVVVLDYSGSMSDDSEFQAMNSNRLGKSAVEDNWDNIWQTLVSVNQTYSNSSKKKFPSSGYGSINSAMGTYISSNDTNTVYQQLGLNQTEGYGKAKYPFPQEGRYSNGNLKGVPSSSTSATLWKDYINWVKSDGNVKTYGYKKRYGYRTLVAYLVQTKNHYTDSEDLWRMQHYPFHAMKEGMSLFCEFLDSLEFGDHIGLVTYDETSRVEEGLFEQGDVTVDLGGELISNRFEDINAIQRHKQAGHYGQFTGMGYGIKSARELLQDEGRYGARPTILLMTDGNANRYPNNWSLPGSWSWSSLTDFDGDGDADYYTNDKAKQYAFWEAKKAIDAGFVIHTLTVGANSDRDLMEAIAFAASGIWIDVPGGATVAEMEGQMLVAFGQIAAKVPPAKLFVDPND